MREKDKVERISLRKETFDLRDEVYSMTLEKLDMVDNQKGRQDL